MSEITLKGKVVNTLGSLPKVGSKAPNFTLTAADLSRKNLSDFYGKKVVLNVFPSIDTDTCAASVREFNKRIAKIENTIVLCVSKDLPFAQSRFCGAEGIKDVIMLSDFANGNFGKDYGLEFIDGPLAHLHSRAVIVIDEQGNVVYTEQVSETVSEPDYMSVLSVF